MAITDQRIDPLLGYNFVVAITDSPLSPLAPLSEAWLEINESEFGGFRSLAATMAVGMALVLAVAQRRQKKAAPRKIKRRQK